MNYLSNLNPTKRHKSNGPLGAIEIHDATTNESINCLDGKEAIDLNGNGWRGKMYFVHKYEGAYMDPDIGSFFVITKIFNVLFKSKRLNKKLKK